ELAVALQERVSSAMENEARSRGRCRCRIAGVRSSEGDSDALVVVGEAGLSKLEFELRENLNGGEDVPGVFADFSRHLGEDAMDLGLFFIEQAHQFVVLFDSLKWFHEDGLTARTGTVDDALHAALLLHLNGDNKAFSANGDQFVLHCAAF